MPVPSTDLNLANAGVPAMPPGVVTGAVGERTVKIAPDKTLTLASSLAKADEDGPGPGARLQDALLAAAQMQNVNNGDGAGPGGGVLSAPPGWGVGMQGGGGRVWTRADIPAAPLGHPDVNQYIQQMHHSGLHPSLVRGPYSKGSGNVSLWSSGGIVADWNEALSGQVWGSVSIQVKELPEDVHLPKTPTPLVRGLTKRPCVRPATLRPPFLCSPP